jgi:low affinity Fe/Cu permease
MLRHWFSHFAATCSRLAGHPIAFLLACLVIVIWAVTGKLFHFSDTWQLVINTGTTIVTFLMVFLIQNSQNRDTTAMQLKLDELLRSQAGAANKMLDVEEYTYEDLETLREAYETLARKAREKEAAKGIVDRSAAKVNDEAKKIRNRRKRRRAS